MSLSPGTDMGRWGDSSGSPGYPSKNLHLILTVTKMGIFIPTSWDEKKKWRERERES